MARKNIKQESLIEALKHIGLRELPDVEQGDRLWVKALALVKKADGSESYACVVKDKNMQNKCVADFGSISAIKEFVEYYPVSYLQQSYIPTFKTNGKEERIKHLCTFFGYTNDELKKKSVKELDKLVLKNAAKQQLNNEG